MSGLKKLTEDDYGEFISVRKMVFNRSNEGRLDPSQYELLSSMVSEKQHEYDVSEFKRFLNHYRSVYETRKKVG